MESANTYTMVTPAEILAERDRVRQQGTIAHTPNSSGNFWARDGCGCYNCRDALDPTGEEDAKMQNNALMKAMCNAVGIEMPPSQPTLQRQFANCLNCEEQHSCQENCRPRGLSLNLPPPSPAQRLTAEPTGMISPLMGLISPRSISDASVSLEEQLKVCSDMEEKVRRYLKRLAKHYSTLQLMIDEENTHRSHDEMAASDTWWTEVDRKKSTTEDLLELLE